MFVLTIWRLQPHCFLYNNITTTNNNNNSYAPHNILITIRFGINTHCLWGSEGMHRYYTTKLEEKFTIVLYSLVNSIAFGVRIALV